MEPARSKGVSLSEKLQTNHREHNEIFQKAEDASEDKNLAGQFGVMLHLLVGAQSQDRPWHLLEVLQRQVPTQKAVASDGLVE